MVYQTGLVLSGGAARGFAHLGVLRALEEFGLTPGIISGVSAGAIAGAFYADGYAPEEILEIYTRKKLFELMQITVPKQGIFKASGLKETLRKNLRTTKLENLPIPLIISATNLLEGKTEFFTQGNLVDLILASSSVPVIFEPVVLNQIPYIDGGVLNNMPAEPLLGLCHTLIGVYINPTGPVGNIKGLLHVAERAFHLAIASVMLTKKQYFDVFIEPEGVTHYGLFDIKNAPEIFLTGYKKANEILQSLKHTNQLQHN